ncbi:type II toxin-antitoxin system RelE family toxin [Rudaeicoccus suwonensis]|uniref:mRNA interferase RelE/StbE n=1 Tax=Rudaeicoccus suwonensis TaxID=657409 RepID=A0A561EB27_9MICO|nr:type II toxin-antitoxin system RelE/ParE family toxin [Rudaeicoccus suwonensis]TWE12806.1 mRNA interferase RelE/StbE [Rudaeicoccus suwonensis]
MSGYAVEFTTAAARKVRRLDPPIRRRILAGIAGLAADPRPDGVKKLSGVDNAWRIRIGDYRVIYEIHDGVLEVIVVEVGHRREVYR